MPKFKNLLALFLCLFVVSACGELGFDKDPNSDDSLEESDDLQKAYRSIQGVYEGTVELEEGGKFSNLPIEISLFTEISFEGRANGELVPQTTLVAIFKFLTISTQRNDYTYKGRYYYRGDGRIQLSAQGINGVWIEALVRGKEIIGGELHEDGLYGRFEARQISDQIRVPAKGRSERDRQRFEEVFAPIIGTYVGKFSPFSRRSPIVERDAQFDFYVIGGELKGRVTGVGNQTGIRPLRVLEFRIDSGFIDIEGIQDLAGSGGGQRGYGYFRARGTLTPGEFRLEKAEDHRGLLGSFCGASKREDLKKVCPSPTP